MFGTSPRTPILPQRTRSSPRKSAWPLPPAWPRSPAEAKEFPYGQHRTRFEHRFARPVLTRNEYFGAATLQTNQPGFQYLRHGHRDGSESRQSLGLVTQFRQPVVGFRQRRGAHNPLRRYRGPPSPGAALPRRNLHPPRDGAPRRSKEEANREPPPP